MRLQRPLAGSPPITQPFGPTAVEAEPPLLGYPHFHQGVDYGVPTGTPVYAPGPGVVMSPNDASFGYGLHVRIDHGNGCFSLLGHLSAVLVTPGQHIAQGQRVALSGNTGDSTGPHLHWSVYTPDWLPVPPAILVYDAH